MTKATFLEIDFEAIKKEHDAYINHKIMPSDQTIETFAALNLIYIDFMERGYEQAKHLDPSKKTDSQEFFDTYITTFSWKELLFFREIAKAFIKFPEFLLIIKEKRYGKDGEEACNSTVIACERIVLRTIEPLIKSMLKEIQKNEEN